MALPDKLPSIYADQFPYLDLEGHAVTSAPTSAYNCVAYAAGDTENWWQPDNFPQFYWPPSVTPREHTLACYVKAFETLGYKRCRSSMYERGLEKIVIYVDKSGVPTHVARQYADGEFAGEWTSKLGKWYDIRHATPRGVEGPLYGIAAQAMKRKTL